jgi:hypothetical protein
LKHNGKALDPIKTNKHLSIGYSIKILLFGDCLELARSINELLPDVVCKLEDSDKVANAKTKAHRDVKHSVVAHEKAERNGLREYRRIKEDYFAGFAGCRLYSASTRLNSALGRLRLNALTTSPGQV